MAGDIPRYFLLRSDDHFIVAQALVAAKQRSLPAAVREVVDAEFERAAGLGRIKTIELPNPGDPCEDDEDGAWVMLAAMRDMAGMRP